MTAEDIADLHEQALSIADKARKVQRDADRLWREIDPGMSQRERFTELGHLVNRACELRADSARMALESLDLATSHKIDPRAIAIIRRSTAWLCHDARMLWAVARIRKAAEEAGEDLAEHPGSPADPGDL